MISYRFDNAEQDEQNEILENAEWILKKDYKFRDNKDDGETALLDSIYSMKQRFGYTDYKDHRKDSMESIRRDILEFCSTHTYQRLHLYSDVECKIPLKKILCWGYLGGISAEFIE